MSSYWLAHGPTSQSPVATLILSQFCRDEITPYMHWQKATSSLHTTSSLRDEASVCSCYHSSSTSNSSMSRKLCNKSDCSCHEAVPWCPARFWATYTKRAMQLTAANCKQCSSPERFSKETWCNSSFVVKVQHCHCRLDCCWTLADRVAPVAFLIYWIDIASLTYYNRNLYLSSSKLRRHTPDDLIHVPPYMMLVDCMMPGKHQHVLQTKFSTDHFCGFMATTNMGIRWANLN